MNEAELETVLEELGDCMEDMARAVDRMKSLNRRMFRLVQDTVRKHQAVEARVQRLEDEKAAERLSES